MSMSLRLSPGNTSWRSAEVVGERRLAIRHSCARAEQERVGVELDATVTEFGVHQPAACACSR
jgi:hypothetical protein